MSHSAMLRNLLLTAAAASQNNNNGSGKQDATCTDPGCAINAWLYNNTETDDVIGWAERFVATGQIGRGGSGSGLESPGKRGAVDGGHNNNNLQTWNRNRNINEDQDKREEDPDDNVELLAIRHNLSEAPNNSNMLNSAESWNREIQNNEERINAQEVNNDTSEMHEADSTLISVENWVRDVSNKTDGSCDAVKGVGSSLDSSDKEDRGPYCNSDTNCSCSSCVNKSRRNSVDGVIDGRNGRRAAAAAVANSNTLTTVAQVHGRAARSRDDLYETASEYRPQFSRQRARASASKAASVCNEYNSSRWKPSYSQASTALAAGPMARARTLERLINRSDLNLFQREAVREELIKTVRSMSNLAQAADDEPIYASVSDTYCPTQYKGSNHGGGSGNGNDKLDGEIEKGDAKRPLPEPPLPESWRRPSSSSKSRLCKRACLWTLLVLLGLCLLAGGITLVLMGLDADMFFSDLRRKVSGGDA